ncbi:MAG: 16S rRNA (guanine(966)-N(2))-methyltransferase RsmD [Paludibacteraceae bacterium]|nr:16S rRNA (guanine(966)-N(2))-methyltransferase RsmD [Paludibacteraceae bacterium]
MRIISGIYGGRRLSPPKNITARPTTDFAKESLFNLLNNRIDFEGIDMLDLFAGTGGIGLEFVSRGAREVTAVELAHVQQNWIIDCCKRLGVKNLNVVRGDVFKFINACRIQYDFIYADPPYALDKLPLIPDLIFEHEMLKKNGMFVLEHSKNNNFSTHPHFVEERSYGNVHFSFFQ